MRRKRARVRKKEKKLNPTKPYWIFETFKYEIPGTQLQTQYSSVEGAKIESMIPKQYYISAKDLGLAVTGCITAELQASICLT